MVKKKYRPWLKAFSGLSINLSAAWFAVPFIGSNFVFPRDLYDFLILILDISLAIMFLLLTVLCERRLEK